LGNSFFGREGREILMLFESLGEVKETRILREMLGYALLHPTYYSLPFYIDKDYIFGGEGIYMCGSISHYKYNPLSSSSQPLF
ncbi:hypothetical protein PN462_10650, partial [Spirulina sp. CS-785/01]|uniref:hypothetical protein n=1 Tax=Spirulina sp. CS-785/01 TaxID=3021716 RepID=UPI00232F6EFF